MRARSRPRPDDTLVTLRLLPGATWVSDYYPTESVETAADGSQTVTLRTADTAVAAAASLAAGRTRHGRVPTRGRAGGERRRPGSPRGIRSGRGRVRPRAGRVDAVWWWVLIWVLLVVIAAVYLATRAWGVWGQPRS